MSRLPTWAYILIIIVGIVIVSILITNFLAPSAGLRAAEADGDGRPSPIQLHTYGYPPGTLDGQPAACQGDPDCGVLCFYKDIQLAYTAASFGLSCIAWDFSPGHKPYEEVPANQ